MSSGRFGWTRWGAELSGPRFATFQTELTKYNALRFQPGLPEETSSDQIMRQSLVANAEIALIESLRRAIAPFTGDIPAEVDGFIAWFEWHRESGTGQGDPLFPL